MLSDTQFWKLLRQELLPLQRLGLNNRGQSAWHRLIVSGVKTS
ncbi:hypothetical protein J2X84_001787 [Pseudomonas corrugata]|nr:hypothetical protein [Pseudomonas corrugata]